MAPFFFKSKFLFLWHDDNRPPHLRIDSEAFDGR